MSGESVAIPSLLGVREQHEMRPGFFVNMYPCEYCGRVYDNWAEWEECQTKCKRDMES